jgi:hypothetical protein
VHTSRKKGVVNISRVKIETNIEELEYITGVPGQIEISVSVGKHKSFG